MKNLREDTITEKEISAYLNSQDDFTLELKAYNACITKRYEASHGGSYVDPVTKKNRQYDVRAIRKEEFRQIRLAVECKNLHSNFPLVVSCVPRTNAEAYHELIVSPVSPYSITPPPPDAVRVFDSKIYEEGKPVGKGMARIGIRENGAYVNDDSEVFDTWSQAVASAHDLVTEKIPWNEQSVIAVFPVLVVEDASLWVVEYDGKGSQRSEPMTVKLVPFIEIV